MSDTLAEEVLLLAYDIRGRCRLDQNELGYGIGGALLSELHLAGRLELDGAVVVAADGAPTDDPILDRLLDDIATCAPARTPYEWVTRLPATGLRDRLLTRMAERGRIRLDRHRTLGVFAGTRYPVRDIVGLWEAQQRVVAAVTTGAPADPRTLALGALVAALRLSRPMFATSGNWRALRDRMRAMTTGDWAAEAVRRAVGEDGGEPARNIAHASR